MDLTCSQVGPDRGVYLTLSHHPAVVCEVISHYRDPSEKKKTQNFVTCNPSIQTIALLSLSFLTL